MSKTLIIFRRDYREISSSTAFRILIGLAVFIAVAASAGISLALRLQPWYGVSEVRPVLYLIMGLILYFLPLFLMISFIWAFASLSVIKEKVNGNIECLLATPINPRQLWIGKALAVFVPAYLVSLIASCLVLLTLNLAVVLPGWHTFVLPLSALIAGLIINPLLFLGLLSFILLFSLAGNPDIAIAPSFLLGFGLMIGVPVGLLTGIVDINSWSFVIWYLAGTLLVCLIILYLTRLLTPQNIVLSSKGS